MIEHKGWRLFTDIERSEDCVRHEHYAMNGVETKHLHCSSYLRLFTPTQERFAYPVDHDFPRAAKGNWYSQELDELIAKETSQCPPE